MNGYSKMVLFFVAITIVVIVLWRMWQSRTIPAMCGHETTIRGSVTAFGEKVTFLKLPVEKGTTGHCLNCLGKMTIRCAWCGGPIFIGDSITLSDPSEDTTVPTYAVHFEDSMYIGCIRPTCSGRPFDHVGDWMPPGKVRIWMWTEEK